MAYYNTCWPPRNNILMVASVGGETLPTSVNGLSLKRDSRLLKGTDWKKELQEEFGSNYDNLGLDGKYYVRYSVPSMWMLGTFKLWTGWAGYKATWGAYWNGHLFFGAPKDYASNNKTEEDVTNVRFNQLMSAPSDHNGINFTTPKDDGGTAKKAYYRTMELYIPVTVTNGNVTAYDFYAAQLYTTQSAGGATIDSKGDDSDKNNGTYMHAGFNPDFSAWPEGYNLTSYTITRHKYDPNADEGTYEPCDKSGVVHYNEDGEIDASEGVIKTSNATFTSRQAFRNQFSFAGSGKLAGYVDDATADDLYAPGMYIYSMEVEFTNGEGKTLKDVVWSPYVHLVEKDVKPNITTAQLIELDEANLEGQYGDYTHITFSTSNDGLLVKLSGNNVLKAERMSSYLPDGTPVKQVRERCAEIYDMYGRWTNKALVYTTIPTSYTQQGGLRKDITTFKLYTENGAFDGGDNLQATSPVNGTYYRVYDRFDKFGSLTFYAEFEGKIGDVPVGSPLNRASATYQTRFPVPRLGEPNFDLITSNGDMEVQVTHEALQEPVVAKTVANSLNFDIHIAMPRISFDRGLAEQVYKQLKLVLSRKMVGATEEAPGTQEIWEGVTYEVRDGQKVSDVFVWDSNEDTFLRYDAQSPFDWMQVDDAHTVTLDSNKQVVLDDNGRPVLRKVDEGETIDPLMGRVWAGINRSWSVAGSGYKEGSNGKIEPYRPGLFADQMDIELNCSFYTPEVVKAHVYKVIAPLNNGTNSLVCRVYLNTITWGGPRDSSIGMTEDELEDDSTSLPVAFTDEIDNNNSPLYAVVARRSEGGKDVDYATSLLTLETSQNSKVPFLLWESEPMPWYDEISTYDPGIRLLVSRAYAFYAANDNDDRYSHFNGILQKQKINGTALAIRYDYKPESDEPQPAPTRVIRRAEGDNQGETSDPVIGDESGNGELATELKDGDNAFLFVPRYADASGAMGQIQTAVDIIDAAEAGVEAGVGYIDVKDNFAIIFDASGKMVHAGDGRVEVPAGVYIVNILRGAMKVIVR